MKKIVKTEIEKLLIAGNVRDVLVYDCIESTNDCALNTGATVFARTQTKGRGRNGRSFFSGEGGLYFSIALFFEENQIRLGSGALIPFSAGRLTVSAGIAVAKALNLFGIDAKIKWVNDIYVAGKKVCGILAERRGDIAAIGIGINLNSSIPDDLASKAASLNAPIDPNVLAASVINGFFHELASPDIEFANANCITLGKTVECEKGIGVAVGIDADGALLILIGDQTERLYYGEVRFLSA